MHLDVLDLRQFYYRTRLGRAAQKSVRDQLTELWPDATGQTVVGFGFAVPLLRPYLGQAARVIGLMPGARGVMPWPAGQDNVSVLCHETRWPLPAGTVDRLVVLHGLETSEHPASVPWIFGQDHEICHRRTGGSGRFPVRAGLERRPEWKRR